MALHHGPVGRVGATKGGNTVGLRFCKIAAGEIPSKKAFEDDRVLALRPGSLGPDTYFVDSEGAYRIGSGVTEENGTIVAHMRGRSKARQGFKS